MFFILKSFRASAFTSGTTRGMSLFILKCLELSISYHLLSGIRHFFWDLGCGYEIKTANLSGIIVIIGSLFLTIILWMIGKGLI